MIFCNHEFNEYCRGEGIEIHRTIRLTPQQNGMTEYLNRTLLEVVRSTLFDLKLPKKFWGEAIKLHHISSTKVHLMCLSLRHLMMYGMGSLHGTLI